MLNIMNKVVSIISKPNIGGYVVYRYHLIVIETFHVWERSFRPLPYHIKRLMFVG